MTGSHPTDSAIYGHLWTTPEASALFSDQGRTQAWLRILAALAQAQAEVGLIPPAAAAAITAHADASQLDLDLIAEQTRATGHSTMGLIRALRDTLPDQAREWVYYGATVQDLSDTWFALVFRALGDIAERDLTRMRDRALELAAAHRDTPMCGRTHGQPGPADHVRVQGGRLGRRTRPAPAAPAPGPSPLGGGPARRGAGHDGVLGRTRA